MDIRFLDRPADLDELTQRLADTHRLALDLEAAGFHRYSDRVCLVQLTLGRDTYILDPFAIPVGDLLRPALQDERVEVVMHGADFDMRLLDRDLGIRPRGLFDTQVAASLLGIEGIGLSSLLERTLGVALSKKYQRADWAKRPLPRPMLEYAALDTHHLPTLADRLRDELEEADRMSWAREGFRALEEVRHEEPEDPDPVTRIRAARKMAPREVHRLREALLWRDEVARDRDRAPFRVANDSVLLEVARQAPRTIGELENLQGFSGSMARERGDDLLRRLAVVADLADAEIRGYPRREPGGRGRIDPEVEDRMKRLKAVRNRKAEELGIARGTLLPNTILMALAELAPRSVAEMEELPGMQHWQRAVLGPELVEEMQDAPVADAGR